MQKQLNLVRMFFIFLSIFLLIINKIYTDDTLALVTMIALIASGTIGLAHGSLDWPLSKLWGLRTTDWDSTYFVCTYILCILATLTLWIMIPILALIIFMLMSVVHFAGDWRHEMRPIYAYILGVAVICLPTLNFYSEVNHIFGLILSRPEATWLTTLMYYLGIITSVLLALKLIYLICLGKHGWVIIELSMLMLIGIALTPLVYFSVYFCCLHAAKHWLTMREIGLYTKISQGIYSIMWPTLLCILVGIITIYDSTRFISYHDALCKTIFIGLASLTVPHWILVEIYGRSRF